MKNLLVSALLMTVLPAVAFASVPDPTHCSAVPCDDLGGAIIAPGTLAGTVVTVSVRNGSNNAVSGAAVSIIFSGDIWVCTDASHTGVTGYDGTCAISLKGGGCVRDTPGAMIVLANGIEIRSYANVKSPDNANHFTSAPSGSVSTADLPYFADEFKGAQLPRCHDYDNDVDCDTADLPYFADAFKSQWPVCPRRE